MIITLNSIESHSEEIIPFTNLTDPFDSKGKKDL